MKKEFIKIFLIVIVLFLGISSVNAASYNVSVGSKSLTKGGSTKLTISGSDVTGRFDISSSNTSVISITNGDSYVWVENNSITITLSALNVGNSTITITPTNVSDGNGNPVSLGKKTISITVSLPREKSTDNTLKSLSVEGFEITPTFNKDVFDYSVTVPEGTKSVKVNAATNESHATVTGTGNIEVTEGINNVSIVVKAENGSTKTYNLIINVIDENPINVDVNGQNYILVKLRSNYTCPDLFTESEITINDNLIPTCFNQNLNYYLVGLKNEEGVVESFIYENGNYTKYNEVIGASLKIIILDYEGELNGFSKVKEKINDIEYNVFRSDKSSKTFVVYGINILNGNKDFYVYDTLNKTFSVYESEQVSNLNDLNNTYLYVIIAFSIALLLSIICIINLNMGKQKLLKKLKGESESNNKKKKEEITQDDKLNENIVKNLKEEKNDKKKRKRI